MNILFAIKPDIGFVVLFPIQFAALFMTLVRKGIFTAGAWHLYYTMFLLSNYVHGYYTKNNTVISLYDYWTIAFVFSFLRFKFHYNKYLLWITIIGVTLYI